jgi:RecB family exonuclease
VPLAETRLGGWLTLAAEAVLSEAGYETMLRLLGQSLTGALDPAKRAAARARRAQGWRAWRELAGETPLLTHLARAGLAPRPLSEWLQWLRDLLAAADLPRRLAAWAAEARAAQALETLLAEMPRWSDRTEPTAAEFFGALAEALQVQSVAADPARGGVALHTPLALYGARYEHVVVLGLGEGLLPARLTDDPWLDAEERRRLSLAGVPQEGAAEGSLWLTRPKVLDRRPLPASRFLKRLSAVAIEPEPLAAGVEELRRALLGRPEELGDDPVATAARAALAVERRRESAAAPDAFDGVLGQSLAPPAVFSVSELRTLGQCPFRWFAERRLGLAEPEEAAAEPEPSLRGSLVHLVLALVARAAGLAGRPADRELMAALVEPALDLAVGGAAGDERLSGAAAAMGSSFVRAQTELQRLEALSFWPLERDEIRAQLQTAVLAPGFLDEGAAPVAIEVWLKGCWRDLPVHGRADRIDRLADGSELLLDYKDRGGNSRPPGIQGPDGGLTVDLQLPIYQALRGGAARAAYLNLRSGQRAKAPAENQDELLADFAADVPRRFADGDFAIAPDRGRAACEYCACDLVCRAGLRLARKRG